MKKLPNPWYTITIDATTSRVVVWPGLTADVHADLSWVTCKPGATRYDVTESLKGLKRPADIKSRTEAIRTRLTEAGLLDWRTLPRKAPKLVLGTSITIRCSTAEITEIKRRAKTAKKTIREFVLLPALADQR